MARKRIFLKEAVELTGSKAELARKLGITRQAISQWNTRKPISTDHVKKLKELYPMEFGNRY